MESRDSIGCCESVMSLLARGPEARCHANRLRQRLDWPSRFALAGHRPDFLTNRNCSDSENIARTELAHSQLEIPFLSQLQVRLLQLCTIDALPQNLPSTEFGCSDAQTESV